MGLLKPPGRLGGSDGKTRPIDPVNRLRTKGLKSTLSGRDFNPQWIMIRTAIFTAYPATTDAAGQQWGQHAVVDSSQPRRKGEGGNSN